MKIGDIVKVHDGSYSMSLVEGVIDAPSGISLQGRFFRVLDISGMYLTEKTPFPSGENDIMLVDVKNPDFVLFSQERFCRVVTSAPQPLVVHHAQNQLEVIVPHRIKGVYLTFEK